MSSDLDSEDPQPVANALEWSVSELSGALKRTVEDAFGFVRVRGEVSGYRGPHSSGHVYFALKDQSAKIEAVIWKGVFGRLKVRPEEGLEVIATGKITTFPGKSSYQIVIEGLELAGLGALMAMLEERRKRLAAEGLFDEARKQLLPALPRVIGVVTSPTGAVIRDILHRLNDRFPTHVIVWPVRVQGETSAAEVAAAINGFNALEPGGRIPRPDLIIVARGGGSLEDLMGFNDEAVVRAAANSMIPLIAAVGHETDWTLIDHAADWRAPTPTAAAEKAVPVRADLLARVDELARRQRLGLVRLIDRRRSDLRAASRALPGPEALLAMPRQRLDLVSMRLGPALQRNAATHRRKLELLSQRLQRQSPAAKLAKVRERVNSLGERLAASRGTLARIERERIGNHRERLGQMQGRMARALNRRMAERTAAVAAVWKVAASLNPRAVLGRGYALVRDGEGHLIRDAAHALPGIALSVEVETGSFGVVVEGGSGEPIRSVAKPAVKRSASPTGGQGDLF
ncbi:MAG: exodeoxyribonuclease VII large subunit [Bosea sp. (in: a-proteobacteria)]